MTERHTMTIVQDGKTRHYLAYIRYMGKLWPQHWHGDMTTGTDEFSHKPVSQGGDLWGLVPLTEADIGLNLDQLARIYPAKDTPL